MLWKQNISIVLFYHSERTPLYVWGIVNTAFNTNQSINQSINQLINQLINQSERNKIYLLLLRPSRISSKKKLILSHYFVNRHYQPGKFICDQKSIHLKIIFNRCQYDITTRYGKNISHMLKLNAVEITMSAFAKIDD